MAVPATAYYRKALDKGDTLPKRPHMHWVRESKLGWVRKQKLAGRRLVAVELGDGATPLSLVEPTRTPTVVLMGHERDGVPTEVLDLVDDLIEIPMIGLGRSLNVSVAGSLALYRLAGLS